MKTRFAASLVLAALAAVPLQAAPVWVPVLSLQGAGGHTLATKLWISNYAGQTRSYSTVFRQTDGVIVDEALQGSVPAERAVFFDKAAAREETGLLEIEAADLRVDAWIQTSRGRQTFMTRVPVISADVQTEGGATAFLNGLDRNLSKIGLVNLGAEAARCDVDFLRADGNLAAASATVVVTAGTLQQFDDALGVLPADRAVTAQVSCSQAFYAFAVAVNPASSEVSFATPESAMAVRAAVARTPRAAIASKGTIVFNAPGLLHKASKQNEKGVVRIPVPQALALRQMTVDWDVTPGPWSTKNRAGAHGLLWLYRGKFRSNTVANVSFYGPNKNFVKTNQNIDLPQGANTNASGNMLLEQGKVFHFHYVYDAAAESIVLTVSKNGRVVRTVRLAGSAAGNTLSVADAGLIGEFGNYSTQAGPEVATWGWSYSNLRVEMVQR
ncbi:MAG TPA: hypothetical protein VGQ28_04400 [Thermoanaerobaculia bacterium]|jgi:hypothetical protein|nr:hypothetical protein [Thermoanaerobaculia bacterium]